MKSEPLVFVGLPVFNGSSSLRKTLETLSDQSFTNIIIGIIDNGSTDTTVQIAEEFVAKDSRFKIHKNEKNIGPLKNFNKTVEIAKLYQPKYFMWAAHDDYYATKFLEKTVAQLESHSEYVLVGTLTSCFDESGEVFVDTGLTMDNSDPSVRFCQYRSLVDTDGYVAAMFYGLIRYEQLLMTAPMRTFIATDHMPLAELVLLGCTYVVQEKLFFKSMGGASNSLERIKQVLGITNPFYYHFPYLNRELEFGKVIWRSKNLNLLQKIHCTAYSFWIYIQRIAVRNRIRALKCVLRRWLDPILKFRRSH